MKGLNYIICAAPRTGSWMLCSLLHQTGIAGNPRECFGQTITEELRINAHVIPVDDVHDFMACVLETGTTPNGVFGLKLMAAQTRMLVRRASEHAGIAFDSCGAAIRHEYPNTRYIHLTRENKVAQAISFYRACLDQAWVVRRPTSEPLHTPVPYNHFGIQRCYQELLMNEAYWAGYFNAHAITPLRLVFEDIVADYARETRRVLAYLGLPSDVPIVPAKTRKLSDEDSLAWEEEFRKHGRIPEVPVVPPETFWAPF